MKKKINAPWKHAILIVVAVTCLYPLVWMILSAFKTQTELYTNPWGIPKEITIDNFVRAFKTVGPALLNSVEITACSVCITVLLSVMASYGLTRLKWRLSGVVMMIFTAGMMIPAYSVVIPLYSIFNKLGILNTHLSVIIAHSTFGILSGTFIMSGFMKSIPREVEEAAVLDGCSVPQMFFRIVLPIVRSGIVTIAVIFVINVWNDLLFSQIFLNEKELMPVTVALLDFKGRYGSDYVGMLAAVIITVVPVVVAYIFLHGRIIDSMTAGAVKG